MSYTPRQITTTLLLMACGVLMLVSQLGYATLVYVPVLLAFVFVLNLGPIPEPVKPPTWRRKR